MKAYLLTAIATLIATPSFAAEQAFLCVADHATGFSYNESTKKWGPSIFSAQNKYLVSKISGGQDSWQVKYVGADSADATCKDGFNSGGTLVCDGFMQFRMNSKTRRFLSSHQLGYFSDGATKTSIPIFKEGANTPYMEIGKCSSL